MLNECALVLEGVTLAQVVELVVEVAVDLAGGAVLDEQAAEDTKTAHPHNLAVTDVSSTRPAHLQCHLPGSPLEIRPFLIHKSISPRCKHSRRHSSIRSTLPLTEPPVPSNPTCRSQLPRASTRVHGDRLANDEAISDELADGLAGVGVRDLVDFVRVEPDLALSTVGDGGREALLRAEIDPAGEGWLVGDPEYLVQWRCVVVWRFDVAAALEAWCGR